MDLALTVTATGSTAGGATTLAKVNMPNYALTVTDPGHVHAGVTNGTSFMAAVGGGPTYAQTGGGSGAPIIDSAATTHNDVTGISVHSGGSGTAFGIVNPGVTTNWCLKVQ